MSARLSITKDDMELRVHLVLDHSLTVEFVASLTTDDARREHVRDHSEPINLFIHHADATTKPRRLRVRKELR